MKLAAQVSDDTTTKGNGGQYGYAISSSDQSLPPQVIAELFKLQPGQISGVINTGYTLEIVKVISAANGKVQAAHIAFNFQSISTYVTPLERQQKPHYFVPVQ